MTDSNTVSTQTASLDSTKAMRAEPASSSITPFTQMFSLETGNVHVSSTANSTDFVDARASNEPIGPSPVSRVYPHVFDDNLEAGQAVFHIQHALQDAQQTIDAFGEPDLAAVATHLGHVAVAMSSAFPLTYFNESLGGVVAFIRRATLAAPIQDLSRSALNALVFVLRSIVSNPMLDLDDATDLVEKLSAEGWQGKHDVTEELLSALLDGTDLDEESRQALLFSEH